MHIFLADVNYLLSMLKMATFFCTNEICTHNFIVHTRNTEVDFEYPFRLG